MSSPAITYRQRKEIDDRKWNACISSAGNGLVYAFTDYLDAMVDNWDALVMNEYESVMPLPWRKKWGISYLYHPFLTAQLGVFGNGLNAETCTAFLDAVPKEFKTWDLSLNHGNLFSVPGFPLYERRNFVLSLNKSYQELHQGYRENIRRNIKKSIVYGCRVAPEVSIDEIIALTRLHGDDASERDLENFKRLFQSKQAVGSAKTYGVLSRKGELLASAAFLFSHNRAYYILVGNHPHGRTLGASHALIDAFIKDHSGQNLLLDFEGSDLRNLAFFYSSFGATEEKYAAIRLNRLPWWLRWKAPPASPVEK